MSSNPWIQHVKKYAKDNGISYSCAISEASKTYKKKGSKTETKETNPKKETNVKKEIWTPADEKALQLLEKLNSGYRSVNKDHLISLREKKARITS